MESNKEARFQKLSRRIFLGASILLIIMSTLVYSLNIYLRDTYDLGDGVLKSLSMPRISNSLVTPEVTKIEFNGMVSYELTFDNLPEDMQISFEDRQVEKLQGNRFLIFQLKAIGLYLQKNKNARLEGKESVTLALPFKVYRDGYFQRSKNFDIEIPLKVDEKNFKCSVSEELIDGQRVTKIVFPKEMEFMNFTYEGVNVTKVSPTVHHFGHNDYISRLLDNSPERVEAILKYRAEAGGMVFHEDEIRLKISSVPYFDAALMTPEITNEIYSLESEFQFKFKHVPGVEVVFSDSFVRENVNGTYSFKAIDALRKYNTKNAPDAVIPLKVEFRSGKKVIGTRVIKIPLEAVTLCEIGNPGTTSGQNSLSGTVPAGSRVYFNGTLVFENKGNSSQGFTHTFTGGDGLQVRVERQGESPYVKKVVLNPVEPEVAAYVPKYVYTNKVGIEVNAQPGYKLVINGTEQRLSSDGSAAYSYSLSDGYGYYDFNIKVFDSKGNLKYHQNFTVNYFAN